MERMTNLRNIKTTLSTLCLSLLLLTGCSKDDETETLPPEQPQQEQKEEPGTPEEPAPQEEPVVMREAHFTDTIVYDRSPLLTNFNFEYPSLDPYGKPVMLSGTITIGPLVKLGKLSTGIVLYNHYTVYHADQCPSRGKLDMPEYLQLLMPKNAFITVSADYYGFGVTEDKPQAYCIPSANARASVDALIAARKLMSDAGYKWADRLFNIGYSQGGQTSIGVLKLVTEEYPDINITSTIAGGGPYDIPETYHRMLESDHTDMPSTVISVLLAYNEFFRLGIKRSDLFKEPLLSHIDDWILSKQYKAEEIDNMVGTNAMTDFAASPILDLESDVSKRLMEALDKENLCKGWKPNEDSNVILIHNADDDTVPVENTDNLYFFLKDSGVSKAIRVKDHWGHIPSMNTHDSGAIVFIGVACLRVKSIIDLLEKIQEGANTIIDA